MVWPFQSRKVTDESCAASDKDRALSQRLHDSHNSLLTAATSAANVAQNITGMLREHLTDSIRQFDAAARIMTDAMIICDANGLIMAFNPAAEKIFGYSITDQTMSRHVASLFKIDGNYPEDTNLWDAIDRVDADTIIVGVHRDGYDFRINLNATYLDRFNGSKLVMILVSDISELQNTKMELQQKKEAYDTLIDISTEGIVITQDGMIVAANPAAEILFGRCGESILLKQVEGLMHCTDLSSSLLPARNATADAICEDGTTKSLIVSVARITWNNAAAILLVVNDSNAIRGLDAVIRSRQTETSVDLMCSFGPDFRIIHANPAFCEYYGRNLVDIVGTPFTDLLQKTASSFHLIIETLTPERPSRRKQILLSDYTGGSRLQDWTDHVFFDKDGKVVEYQRTGRDVTDILTQIKSVIPSSCNAEARPTILKPL